MSRSTRPLRRVRGADRDRVLLLVTRAVAPMSRQQPPEWLARHADRAARELGTRPAIVRRCLLGRVVSARAVDRLLRAA